MTLKIERVFEKTNYIFSPKLAKRAMNWVSKKDHNKTKKFYMRKKFIKKIKSLYTMSNLCVVIEIIAS